MSINTKKRDHPHYGLLAHLLRGLVAERFKRMAKDEVLSKFVSARVDPAILVDHSLQSEREALDLAEMSLLELVDSERLNAELKRSSEKIQNSFQQIFGEKDGSGFLSEDLIQARMNWLKVRVDFYRKWLSYSEKANSPTELAAKSFRSAKSFDASLNSLLETDKNCAEEIIRATPSFFRFLMKKQMDYELSSAEDVWREFRKEAFKKIPELSE